MSDDTPFQATMRRSADSAVLTFAARWAMVISLPIGGFIGTALWTKLDKASESTARLEEKMQGLLERELPTFNLTTNSRINAQADRITDLSGRIGKLEDWRNTRANP